MPHGVVAAVKGIISAEGELSSDMYQSAITAAEQAVWDTYSCDTANAALVKYIKYNLSNRNQMPIYKMRLDVMGMSDKTFRRRQRLFVYTVAKELGMVE